MIRVYLPSNKSVKVIRRSDFRLIREDRLPGISTLIDGLSRQASIEVDEDVEKEQANAEAHLVHCLLLFIKTHLGWRCPTLKTMQEFQHIRRSL